MTEQEYITIQEYTIITDILSLFSEIIPDNSEVIENADYQIIMHTLNGWRNQYCYTIEECKNK